MNKLLLIGCGGHAKSIIDVVENKKDWQTADKIREGLNNLNIEIQDKKDGSTWNYRN